MDYYENIVKILKEDGVYDEFIERVKKLSGGAIHQKMFDFLYETYKLNPTMFNK